MYADPDIRLLRRMTMNEISFHAVATLPFSRERREKIWNCGKIHLIHSDWDGSFVPNIQIYPPILPVPRNSYFSIWISNTSSDLLFPFMFKRILPLCASLRLSESHLV
uniref:Uncharacterized protein n=1 Tax=Lepeophtheirus salmonis TaxID=72036 RepID=A0A0K2V851_LEPSM